MRYFKVYRCNANQIISKSSKYYWLSKVIVKLSVVSDSLWPHGLYSPWNFPGQNTRVGSLSLLQGIFPTQGSNPGLLDCRHILYQLSHKASLVGENCERKPQGKTGVGSLSLLQGIFLTQESNRGLLHCRQIHYQLCYQGNHYWLLVMCKIFIPAWFKSIWFPFIVF